MKLLELKQLLEINMSPSALRDAVSSIDARAGMEFEMIVPGVGGADEDGEPEPDYDSDERIRRFSDIRNFFHDGDYNSRRDVERLMNEIWEDYMDSDWLSEKKQEAWEEVAEDHIRDLVERYYAEQFTGQAEEEVKKQAPEFGMNSEEIQKAVNDRYKKLFMDKVEEIMADMGEEYDQAFEEWQDDQWNEIWNDDDMFTDWAQDSGIRYMSDIPNNYDITWPNWSSPESEGELDISQVADEFRSEIGRPVNWSRNYHGGKRAANTYVVEPDGSLNGDSYGDVGLEFVSPPLPIQELHGDLKKVRAWAGRMGAYTNESTGLHINVSVPGWKGNLQELDYVKLALLLGDEYVLDQFGRSGNSYTKSAFGIVKSHIKQRPQDAEALMKQMKDHLNAAASKLIHTGVTQKYTSINVKDGYIEFRSPGGDWLGDNFDAIENTLLRFVVAMDAAVDPEKHKEEYAKKLYKLLSASNDTTDTLQYFVQFSAGTLPRSALSSFIKQAQLKRQAKKGMLPIGKKYWWDVSKSDSTAGLQVVAASREEAIEKARNEYPEWRNAQNITANPIKPYEEQPRQQPAGTLRPSGQSQPAFRQPMPNVGTQTEMENRLGWGSQSADANYEIIDRSNNRTVFLFIANTDQEAERKYEDWLAAAGFPSDTENYGWRRRN